jgi:hypothetical protein
VKIRPQSFQNASPNHSKPAGRASVTDPNTSSPKGEVRQEDTRAIIHVPSFRHASRVLPRSLQRLEGLPEYE